MTERHIRIGKDDLERELLPALMSRVFHVTTEENLAGIRRDGFIKTNKGGQLCGGFGYARTAFLTKNGYVCLFDLRNVGLEKVKEELDKLYFLYPQSHTKQNCHAYLFLKEYVIDKLILWEQIKKEMLSGDMVIPRIESGYLGDLPIADIDEILHVEVDEPAPSLFTEAVFKASRLRD